LLNLQFSENSLLVIRNKYLRKNEKFEVIETPVEWLRRVAKALTVCEETEKLRKEWEEKFLDVMGNLEFLPGGRTLANSGTVNGQLANCFVLPFEDNVEEVFESVKESSILKKNGGGVGFSFSKIRPKGDAIMGTTGSACGPVALMKIVDAASEILMQSGGRRSGNMVVLNVDHPDVFEFITCKEQNTALNQINFSLGVTNKFMEAVLKDKNWDLINPRTGRVSQTVSARSIFELAATYAWKNGDPGMIFLDRINLDNPTPQVGPLTAVNLCGEQPLLPYEACNLGSINLVRFVVSGDGSDKFGRNSNFQIPISKQIPNSKIQKENNERIDWDRLDYVVRVATRMLDNVISVCKYPLAKVDRVVKSNRKIGLGVMGWADMLVKLNISYGSEESFKLAEKVMKFIQDVSHDESQKLGAEKGSFPNFEGSRWQKKMKYKTMRNSTCTTIAPTGSISMASGVSSGIEPLFALSYYKQVMGGMRIPEVNQDLLLRIQEELKNNSKKFEEIKEYIVKNGNIQNVKELSKNTREVFKTAMDLSGEAHIKMQAAFQKFTDNAVSKTINLPQNASVREVEKAFILSWKLKCKGITVYRDKSRDFQVLNVGTAKSHGDHHNSSAGQIKTNIGIMEKKYAQTDGICPECGGKLRLEEGCKNCPGCGWSACAL
jgi:ribonucleoside-diphosphate reductase alpha chain